MACGHSYDRITHIRGEVRLLSLKPRQPRQRILLAAPHLLRAGTVLTQISSDVIVLVLVCPVRQEARGLVTPWPPHSLPRTLLLSVSRTLVSVLRVRHALFCTIHHTAVADTRVEPEAVIMDRFPLDDYASHPLNAGVAYVRLSAPPLSPRSMFADHGDGFRRSFVYQMVL